MSLPPESIQAGGCYLMETGGVRQVVAVLLNGLVLFQHRLARRVDRGARLLGSRDASLCRPSLLGDSLRLDTGEGGANPGNRI